MSRRLLIGVLGLAAAGAAAAWMLHRPIAQAEEAVLRELNDPESARFEQVTIFSDGTVCGRVNAKNTLGGYDGFREFVIYPRGQVRLMPPTKDEDIRGAAKLIMEVACRDK